MSPSKEATMTMKIEQLDPDNNASYNQRHQLLKLNELIAAVNSLLPDQDIEQAVVSELIDQQKG